VVKADEALAAAIELARGLVPEEELSFTYTRSPGPGGQNVNKTNTRTTLVFDLPGAAYLSDSQKDRIRTKLATRISRAGLMRVVSYRYRTQHANRLAATDRFYELIGWALCRAKIRRPTTTPARVRRRRLEDKRRRGHLKRLRGRPSEAEAEG
jgi:ribosome-associated protein